MKRMTFGTAAVLAALMLAACGGGDPAPSAPPEPMPPGDAAGLEGILERADTLLATGAHSRWTLSDGETEIGEAGAEVMACAGAVCVDSSGMVTTVADLRGAFAGRGAGRTQTGTRGGFDTAAARSGFEVTQRITGATVMAMPEAMSWGIWGEHGFGVLVVSAGPLAAQVEGTAFTGRFSSAAAWALGDAAGSNPEGLGSAVWRGVAEAASTATFTRLAGTATVTIADLSRPRVGVEIAVFGHDIGAPGWADVPLVNGRFSTGTAGADYLAGDFHGPQHEEAWGVFDTGAYVGAFGAKRTP
ncbi:MAG: hypothetical protein OXU75_17185 [Deltaproteobacteria bacterium]|nr:hypothetical protein [Deltaproteobacteria bacterium]